MSDDFISRCVEVIVFIALALYLGLLLYFKIKGEKIIMKQITKRLSSLSSTKVVQSERVMTREEAIQILSARDAHGVLCGYTSGVTEALDMAIEALSAEAEWVPVSERLPSDDEYVIVSVLDDHGDTPWKYTTVAWLCNGVWISDNDILCGTAIAWMPLSPSRTPV